MRKTKETPKPGEWQREPGKFGRRFRMVGYIKEYEPEIMTTHGTLTQDQLEAFNKREKGE